MIDSIKSKMRRRALLRRESIEAVHRERFAARLAILGARIVRKQTSDNGGAGVVSLYAPIGAEPDSALLAGALRAMGTELVLPVDWSHGSSLIYRRWRADDRLAAGPLGIVEPLGDSPRMDPDILFIPVVAFDRRGYRLGYGAGNVDRTLAALRRQKSILVVGVGYASQEVGLVPAEAHDQKLDMILTERGVAEFTTQRAVRAPA